MFHRTLMSLAAAALLVSACSSTERAREVRPSGFLGDYAQMQAGGENRALLTYTDPNADFSRYDKLIIDPITVWTVEGSDMAEVPKDELAALVATLDAKLRDALSDWQLVEEAGPGTLRLRAALTEAEESVVAMDIISSVLPIGWVVGGGTKLASGTWSFVGSASAEAEVVDSVTGKRLLAGVDRQAGGKSAEGITESWSDVELAFDKWANQIASRLAEEQAADS
jgi:hypothetical protein